MMSWDFSLTIYACENKYNLTATANKPCQDNPKLSFYDDNDANLSYL